MQFHVYDPHEGRFFIHAATRSSALPHTGGAELPLRDLLGSTRTEIAWTDRRLLAAFGELTELFPLPIAVSGGFRRAVPGRRLCASPRCAGLSLDMGRNLSDADRERLRLLAARSGLFEYVLPAHIAPTWVGVQKRIAPPCAPNCPLPALHEGDESVYVFALQDALRACGFPPDSGLTGRFCDDTRRSLAAFCRAHALPYAGTVGAAIWREL